MISINKDSISQGFQMAFPNGWTVSVQFGRGNYCSDRGNFGTSIDAEIAAWNEAGEWHKFPDTNDVVKGWVTALGVAEFIDMVSKKEK